MNSARATIKVQRDYYTLLEKFVKYVQLETRFKF